MESDFRLISAPIRNRQYKKGNTVSNQLNRRLALLDDDEHRALLGQGLRGIERETLRVDAARQAGAHAASRCRSVRH